MESIERDVRRFIVDNFLFGQEDAGLAADTPLLQNRIIDSTGILELIMYLEEKYAIKLEDAEIIPDNLDSIGNLTRLIARKAAWISAHPEEGGLPSNSNHSWS
jgi:acyl carrier protein